MNVRNIERGSTIISVVEEKVILQINPRGNLETIQPRYLLLFKIKNLIRQHNNYRKAFEIVRSHKIPLTTIIYLDLDNFIDNAQDIFK